MLDLREHDPFDDSSADELPIHDTNPVAFSAKLYCEILTIIE